MVLPEKYWKITINGPSIQGVMLREAITSIRESKELAGCLENITGFARNFEDGVEVIIRADESTAAVFLEAISRIPESPGSMGIVHFCGKPSLEEIQDPTKLFSQDDFSGFGVKRDGEQKEMMLALQGAGKLFNASARIQREVFGLLRERDEKKVIGLLLSIFYEASENRIVIKSKDSSSLSVVALVQGLTNPPIPTSSFVYQMNEVYRKINDFKNLQKEASDDEILSVIKTLSSFLETVALELKARDIKIN